MPTELLAFPPAYTIVGAYRSWTDPSIREPVIAKIKHASVRGLAVGAVYALFGWGLFDWVVRRFVVPGRAGERIKVGAGSVALSVDIVLYTHIMMLLPQLSRILKFFIKKNLRIARGRAYNLTVTSRGKPAEFWSESYYEEWAHPPQPSREQRKAWGSRKHREPLISWILWWPSQMLIRQYILFPLSPILPLLAPLAIASMRALGTAEYLHQPYFQRKKMGSDQMWLWIEERKWAYRSFGFAAALLESIPIVGLWFSISNRIGAAMWAHDLEKRQHLFLHRILQPLAPSQVGIFGSGNGLDVSKEAARAEKAIEAKWSSKPAYVPTDAPDDGSDTPSINFGPAPPLPPRKDAPPPYAPASSSSMTATAAGIQHPPRLPPRPQNLKQSVPQPMPGSL